MHTVIAYDINDNQNRLKVFRILSELGFNTQRSVFECELQSDEILHLVSRLTSYIDPESDSLLVYPLCRRCAGEVAVLGHGGALVQTDWQEI